MPSLLIVDDEKDNLDALKRLLRKDFEIFTASSAQEALALIPSLHGKIDVIISDQRMPGMSGVEFLEKTIDLDALPTRLLLTGFTDLDAVINAINRGQIWRYIPKPWEPDDLKRTLLQAAERSQLQRSLTQYKASLETAVNELRAKDWARERLLLLLLHEFRTVPQILEGLSALNPQDEDAAIRLRMIDQLRSRFSILETDIKTLLEEEKNTSQLERTSCLITDELQQMGLHFSRLNDSEAEPKILAHQSTLQISLKHMIQVLASNTESLPPQIEMDWAAGGAQPMVYLSLIIDSPTKKALLPKAVQNTVSPEVAWRALLEPFVGVDDFLHHSTGLRIDTAKHVRQLAAFGARAEFVFKNRASRIELLIAFNASAIG